VNARAGDAVEAGAVIARFDDSDLQARVDQARTALEASEAALALAQSNVDKTRRLVEREVSSQAALDQAENNLVTARSGVSASKAGLLAAETQLGDAVITAPFAGILSERLVDPGEMAAAGTRLFTLVDLASLEVEGSSPASMITRVAVGQTAALNIEGIDGRVFEARVDRISPVALPGTRAIPVFLALDNADGLLRGGMFATGRITLEAKQGALAVPLAAVREDAEGRFVLAVVDGKAERRAVETGPVWNDGTLIEIISGLAVGDTIVSAPLPTLAAGALVIVEQS